MDLVDAMEAVLAAANARAGILEQSGLMQNGCPPRQFVFEFEDFFTNHWEELNDRFGNAFKEQIAGYSEDADVKMWPGEPETLLDRTIQEVTGMAMLGATGDASERKAIVSFTGFWIEKGPEITAQMMQFDLGGLSQ